MELIYLYHSGVALLTERATLIFDFYEDTHPQQGLIRDLLKREGAVYVFSTHSHYDHFNPKILEWKALRPDLTFVFSTDIRDQLGIDRTDVVWLEQGQHFTDNHLAVHAFGSTDIGISLLVEIEGKRIFHSGDLNNWHWMEECDEAEWRGYERAFLEELDFITQYTREMDLVIFPIDPRLGAECARGAKQLVEKIKTAIFVPIHFDEKYLTVETFRSYFETRGIRFVCLHERGAAYQF